MVAVSGAFAAQAQAVQKTLNYTCVYPFVDEQPLSVDLTASIPNTYPAETATPPFQLSAVATAQGDTATALETVGAKELEGSTKAAARIQAQGGQNLGLKVPLAIPRQAAVLDANRNFKLNVSGETPEIQFSNEGPAQILVGGLALTLKAYTKAGKVIILKPESTKVPQTGDSDPETFEVTCALKPAETATGFSVLQSVQVTPYTDGEPVPYEPGGTPTPTPVATPGPTATPVATPGPTTTPVATPAPTTTPVATPAPTSTPVA
ncbi:MAG: hypothetical protein Q7T55_13665, partial [Solirubrobacteraceae bacterium]|nr:hypothetical protein [Solirubrobacteraceae bacterium]